MCALNEGSEEKLIKNLLFFMFLKSFQFSPWSVMRSKATNLHTITITKVNNVRMECLVHKTTPFNGIMAVMISISLLMMIVLYICWRLTQNSFIWIIGTIDSLTPNRTITIAVCISFGAKRVVNVHRTRTHWLHSILVGYCHITRCLKV